MGKVPPSISFNIEENYYLQNFCFNIDTIFSRIKINKLLCIPIKASRLLCCCVSVPSRDSEASLDVNSISCRNSVYFTRQTVDVTEYFCCCSRDYAKCSVQRFTENRLLQHLFWLTSANVEKRTKSHLPRSSTTSYLPRKLCHSY